MTLDPTKNWLRGCQDVELPWLFSSVLMNQFQLQSEKTRRICSASPGSTPPGAHPLVLPAFHGMWQKRCCECWWAGKVKPSVCAKDDLKSSISKVFKKTPSFPCLPDFFHEFCLTHFQVLGKTWEKCYLNGSRDFSLSKLCSLCEFDNHFNKDFIIFWKLE